jgi:hypothetical protein
MARRLGFPDVVLSEIRAREVDGLIELPTKQYLRRSDRVRILRGPFSHYRAEQATPQHAGAASCQRRLRADRRVTITVSPSSGSASSRANCLRSDRAPLIFS